MDKQEKEDSKMTNGDIAEALPLKSEAEDVNNMNFREKLKYVKNNITVEPVLALFVMSSVLAILAIQNLNLGKVCRVNLGYNDSVCTNLKLRKRDNLTKEEQEVQKLMASVQSWKSVAEASVPTILLLFMGAWSDKTGRRKICMLLPIIGELLTCTLNMINTYFFYQTSVQVTVLMEVIGQALTGGWYIMFLGTFSYIGDITSKETRTFRMGILSLCMTVGFPIGMGLSGVLLKKFGYYAVFTISAILQIANLCYILFAIEDHQWLKKRDTQERKPGCTGFLLEFFDFRSLKRTLEIVFKRGAKNRRLRVCLVLTVVCLSFGTMKGEMSILYFFCRYRFNWEEVKFSMFSVFLLITHSLGTLFMISVISKRMRVDDSVLGIIASTSKICGMLILAFATTTAVAYLVPVAEMLSGAVPVALRSISSKLVTYQELGKVFSLFGIAEAMMPLIFAPMYSQLYQHSLLILPGAPFLLTVLFTIPSLGIFIWFYQQHRKDRRQARLEVPSSPTSEDPVMT